MFSFPVKIFPPLCWRKKKREFVTNFSKSGVLLFGDSGRLLIQVSCVSPRWVGLPGCRTSAGAAFFPAVEEMRLSAVWVYSSAWDCGFTQKTVRTEIPGLQLPAGFVSGVPESNIFVFPWKSKTVFRCLTNFCHRLCYFWTYLVSWSVWVSSTTVDSVQIHMHLGICVSWIWKWFSVSILFILVLALSTLT